MMLSASDFRRAKRSIVHMLAKAAAVRLIERRSKHNAFDDWIVKEKALDEEFVKLSSKKGRKY